MSIIEKIKETEDKADKIREDATLEVSKMLEKTEIENKEKILQLYENAKQKIKDEKNECLKRIDKLKEEKDTKLKEIENNLTNIYKQHLDETIDYIMKKVMEL